MGGRSTRAALRALLSATAVVAAALAVGPGAFGPNRAGADFCYDYDPVSSTTRVYECDPPTTTVPHSTPTTPTTTPPPTTTTPAAPPPPPPTIGTVGPPPGGDEPDDSDEPDESDLGGAPPATDAPTTTAVPATTTTAARPTVTTTAPVREAALIADPGGDLEGAPGLLVALGLVVLGGVGVGAAYFVYVLLFARR